MIDDQPSGRIFISYRRSDAQHIAGRLFDRLEARFGSGHVFMDVDSIEPGMDYGEAIDEAVGSCDVLLAVIGNHWVDAVDDYGRRRLDDPDDLVVLEIGTALQRKVRVIPVLVDGAPPPRRNDLPTDLEPLARRHAVRLDHALFNPTTAELLAALDRALASYRSRDQQSVAAKTEQSPQDSSAVRGSGDSSAPAATASQTASQEFELTMKQEGVMARAHELDGKFVVLAGSSARRSWIGTNSGYKVLRERLERDGTLARGQNENTVRFTRDQISRAPVRPLPSSSDDRRTGGMRGRREAPA